MFYLSLSSTVFTLRWWYMILRYIESKVYVECREYGVYGVIGKQLF